MSFWQRLRWPMRSRKRQKRQQKNPQPLGARAIGVAPAPPSPLPPPGRTKFTIHRAQAKTSTPEKAPKQALESPERAPTNPQAQTNLPDIPQYNNEYLPLPSKLEPEIDDGLNDWGLPHALASGVAFTYDSEAEHDDAFSHALTETMLTSDAGSLYHLKLVKQPSEAQLRAAQLLCVVYLALLLSRTGKLPPRGTRRLQKASTRVRVQQMQDHITASGLAMWL